MIAAVGLFALPEDASAQAFWNWGAGDYAGPARPARAKRAKVKRKVEPADVHAQNAAKPEGPLVISVSVEKQRVKVYDINGLFAEAPVSTGTKTHPTPMGVFSIIQKNRHHYSNLYGAAMPYMQRITWSGVAMHTGPLPGYAASHGCIRLPNEFASRLWTWTRMGTRVIVAPGEVAPKDFSHPKLLAKMTPLPTVSAAPALTVGEASRIAQQRTADARQVIEGMKGTLSDISHAPPAASKAAEAASVEAKAAVSAAEAKPATPSPEAAAEPQQLGFAATRGEGADAPADAKVDATPVKTAQKAAPTDELAVKPEDRTNNDDSETTSAAEPAQPQKAEDKPAEPKAVASPVETKPAEPVQEIAKPADIAKPATTDIAKPADIVKPTDAAKPAELPKPVVATAPRRNNHVAVFISRKDKKLYIRHGYEPIYDTPIEIADADKPLGTHVFTARGDKADAQALHWTVVSLPVLARTKAEPKRASRQAAKPKAQPAPVQHTVVAMPSAAEALDRITIPDEALEKIASIITPGGSILISDYGLTGWETGKGTDFIVPLRQ